MSNTVITSSLVYFLSADDVIAVPADSRLRYESLYPMHAVKTSAEDALKELHDWGCEDLELVDITDLVAFQVLDR